MNNSEKINSMIRRIPDFPQAGVLFYDISTLLSNAEGLSLAVDQMAELVAELSFDKIAAMESRGFIFGSALAYKLNKGLILMRKKGKLPGNTISVPYGLEYGKDILEVSDVAVTKPGERILIVDDLLATGGTAKAGAELITKLAGVPVGLVVLIELIALNGRARLGEFPVRAALAFS